MASLHPQKPWNGNRKNLTWGMPIVVIILGILIYIVFFHLDPATEDLLFPRIIISILALMFLIGCIYSVFRDVWWIYIPYNDELFDLVSQHIEKALAENSLLTYSDDSEILGMLPNRKSMTLAVTTGTEELGIVLEMIHKSRNENGSSYTRIKITNISSRNRMDAYKAKKAITDLLYQLKYNSYDG
jgi:hypothetical protein